MEFMDKIYKEVEPLWKACLQTDFIKDMEAGRLTKERFLCYMKQDAAYLLYYTKLCAKAIVNATSEEEIKIYASMIAYVNGTELETREENALIQRKNLLPAAKRYIDYLMEVYEDKDNDRIFLVLVNCMLSYDYIFTRLVRNMKEDNPHRFFVEDYASQAYRDFCDRWIAFMNKKYAKITDKDLLRYNEILKKACSFEYDFWEMAYHQK